MKNLKVLLVVLFAMVANIGISQFRFKVTVNDTTMKFTNNTVLVLHANVTKLKFEVESLVDENNINVNQKNKDDEYIPTHDYSGSKVEFEREREENDLTDMVFKLSLYPSGAKTFFTIKFDPQLSTSEVLRDFLTFQNPVTNTLKLNTDFDCDVQIYNQNGQLVDETKTSAFSDNTIDFSNKINGMYIMVVRKGDAVFKERILKQ